MVNGNVFCCSLIHSNTHTDGGKLSRRVLAQTSGAIWASVFCPRTLPHANGWWLNHCLKLKKCWKGPLHCVIWGGGNVLDKSRESWEKCGEILVTNQKPRSKVAFKSSNNQFRASATKDRLCYNPDCTTFRSENLKCDYYCCNSQF